MSTFKIASVEPVFIANSNTGFIRVTDYNGDTWILNQAVPNSRIDSLRWKITDAGEINLQYWHKEEVQIVKCPKCNGTGLYVTKKASEVCYSCKGKGVMDPKDRSRCNAYFTHFYQPKHG